MVDSRCAIRPSGLLSWAWRVGSALLSRNQFDVALIHTGTADRTPARKDSSASHSLYAACNRHRSREAAPRIARHARPRRTLQGVVVDHALPSRMLKIVPEKRCTSCRRVRSARAVPEIQPYVVADGDSSSSNVVEPQHRLMSVTAQPAADDADALAGRDPERDVTRRHVRRRRRTTRPRTDLLSDWRGGNDGAGTRSSPACRGGEDA